MERQRSVRREVGAFSEQLSWRMVSKQSTKTRTLTIITELGQLHRGGGESESKREGGLDIQLNIHEMCLCKHQ